jgi:hypothetical protein
MHAKYEKSVFGTEDRKRLPGHFVALETRDQIIEGKRKGHVFIRERPMQLDCAVRAHEYFAVSTLYLEFVIGTVQNDVGRIAACKKNFAGIHDVIPSYDNVQIYAMP